MPEKLTQEMKSNGAKSWPEVAGILQIEN
jgi:hypothetical protein